MIERIKGTQDFLDMSLFNFIYTQCARHLALYHFEEISTPIVEPTELFKRSLGLQTDVVSKEMFTIVSRTDCESESICLRPEATASIVRAFIENNVQQTPWKVYVGGPMFRYERPQKGRYRQFHQVSIEVIGAASVMYDVQFIAMLDRFFHEKLLLNDYVLMLNFLGCPEDRVRYKRVLREFLDSDRAADICSLCKERKEKNILRTIDCKNQTCQLIYKDAPRLVDHLCPPCSAEWVQLQRGLELLSVTHVCTSSLVRGLDYYNKTVFEFASERLGAQSTFCAGGRYDQLVKELGGKEDEPSVGAALGIERIMLLLEPLRAKLALPEKQALHVIMPLGAEQHALALLLAENLQHHGFCIDVFLDNDSPKSMMRKAHKLGASSCLILGTEEQQNRTVTIKNMVTGSQETVDQARAHAHL